MKRISSVSLTSIVVVSVLTPMAGVSQQRGDTNDAWCNEGRSGRSERFCEVREFRLPVPDLVAVDGGSNGGVEVTGWDRDEVLVRAKVEAWSNGEDPKAIADAIEIRTEDGRIHATGPGGNGRRGGWAVSFDVMVPFESDLSLDATNGGIAISGVTGDLDFHTTNGGIRLDRIGGDVRGRTTNGGINVEIETPDWPGRGLDLQTTNGAVTLEVPTEFKADLMASTVNGGISTDFPIAVQGRFNSRRLEAELNGGGPPVRLETVNGRVALRKR
jgi:Toastrack DUF4097